MWSGRRFERFERRRWWGGVLTRDPVGAASGFPALLSLDADRRRTAVSPQVGGRNRGVQAGKGGACQVRTRVRGRSGWVRVTDGRHAPLRTRRKAVVPAPTRLAAPGGNGGRATPAPWWRRQRWPSLHRSPNGHSPLSRPADDLRWWRGHGRPTGAVGAWSPGAPVRLACARARPLRRGAGGGGGFGGHRMRDAAPPGGPVLAQGSRARRSIRSEGVGSPSGGEGPIMGSGGA